MKKVYMIALVLLVVLAGIAFAGGAKEGPKVLRL